MPIRGFLRVFLVFSIALVSFLAFSYLTIFPVPPAAAQNNWIRQVVVRIVNEGTQPVVLMGREVQYDDRSEWVEDLWIVNPESGQVEQVPPQASQQTTRDLNVCLNPPRGKSPEQLNCHYLFIGPPRF